MEGLLTRAKSLLMALSLFQYQGVVLGSPGDIPKEGNT